MANGWNELSWSSGSWNQLNNVNQSLTGLQQNISLNSFIAFGHCRLAREGKSFLITSFGIIRL